MLVVSPTSISENGGRATVAATLSNPAPIGGASLTVNARGGSGYSLSPNRTLTFAAGAGFSTGTVTITAEHDADTENETVTVSATVASGAITAPAAVTLIIQDDDDPPDPLALPLTINSGTIAGDGIVNKVEKASGFAITGSTESGASVTVTVGGTQLPAVTAGSNGSWTVEVLANASYVTEEQVTVSATATKSGYSDGADSTTVTVDVTAPSVTYEPPTLTVGTTVRIAPSTSDIDIDSYALAIGSTLPSGLRLAVRSGVISGAPTAAGGARAVTVVVSDDAGNATPATLSFPIVAKGTQRLTGFTYSPSTVTLGDPAPAVTAPRGARGTLSYSTSTSSVCTVNSASGALMVLAEGTCTVTATAAMTANYNAASVQASVIIEEPSVEPTFQVTVLKAGTGTGDVDLGSGRYRGSTPFTATGTGGSTFSSWSGCDSVDENVCTVNVTRARTITATFNAPTYSLRTSEGPNGSIRPAPGTYTYAPTTPVTVAAAPNTGYQVDAWGGDCAGTSARSLTCGLTMNANKTASVTFRKCELRVLSAGNGTVAGGGTVDCGSRPRITATPDSNYCYDRWDGEFGVRSETTPRSPECHAGGNFSVTVHRDVTYTAHFVEKPKFTLTTTAGANGNISPSGSNQYYFDKTVTITADPNEGYEVDAWSGDCAGVTGTACTVAMNTDRTAGVTFEDIPPIYSSSGWCYDLGGTADSGSGLSEAAAHTAGQAFKDSCRPGGFTSTVTEDTDWYAYVTCDGGATFNLGPFDSMSAAETGAGLIISAACGSGLTRLSLPVGDSLTVAQVREALRSALAALPTPVDLDDLTLPVAPKGQDGPTHGGSFSTYVGDDGRQYAAVTCDDERSFTLGPANTLVEILDAGFLGLRVCANGDALTELSLPESGTVTRAQLEGAITTALAASSIELTLRDLAAPPAAGVTARAPVQVRGGSYTLSSTTTWVWKVTCTAGGSEGGIATSEESVVLAVAGAAAGCPRGGGDYSVSPD